MPVVRYRASRARRGEENERLRCRCANPAIREEENEWNRESQRRRHANPAIWEEENKRLICRRANPFN